MALALFAGGGPVQASDQPGVVMPDGMGPVPITRSDIAAPENFHGAFRAIGDVYEIGDPNNPVRFENGYAKIEYRIDMNKINEAGLLPEFQVYWFDRVSEEWKPVDRVSFNSETNVLTAYTSHLTPFVPAATIASSGDTTPPPSCVADDYPQDLGGNNSNSAGFMIVGEGFQYYKDRTYTIVPTSSSSINQTSFSTYGFSNAIGIATCNGNNTGIAGCGPNAQEKSYAGNDYIVFTAQSNIDLYLMYDTRGGVNLNDASRDASWIASTGFVNTGHFIETTDPMRFYRIYRKSYNTGEEVRLHGNKNGVGSGAIDTNYWLIMKPQGNTAVTSPSSLCVSSPPSNPGSASIQIRQGGSNLNHGGNYNFGTTTPGGTIGPVGFYIHNFGDSELQLTGTPVVSITGADASYFHVAQPTFPITSGQSASYSIEFTPVTAGMKFAIMKVESSDLTTPLYTVGLQGYAPSSAKSISSFSIASPTAIGTIVGNDINLSVPFGTNVTDLVASFTFTGVQVRVGGVIQTSGVTANNFTNPVVYTVHAQDGTTQNYTVSASVKSPIELIETPSLLRSDNDLLVRWQSAIGGEYSIAYGIGTAVRDNFPYSEITNRTGIINSGDTLSHNHVFIWNYYSFSKHNAIGRIRLLGDNGITYEKMWDFRIETIGPVIVEAVGITSGSFSFELTDGRNNETITFTEDGIHITIMESEDGAVLDSNVLENTTGKTCSINHFVNHVDLTNSLVNVRVNCVE